MSAAPLTPARRSESGRLRLPAAPPAGTHGERRRGALVTRAVVPPLVAFLAVRVALYVGAGLSGFDYFRYLSWHRFDSGFYVGSATQGYTFLRCTAPTLHGWCGRAGWFPGYSMVIGLLAVVGVSPRTAALTVSLTFCGATLLVVWVGLLRCALTARNLLALAFAAFVPGHIYDHTVFPLAMASFFVVLAFVCLDRRRWALAGLAGAVACATYPTAVLIAPVSALWLLLSQRELPWPGRLRRAAFVGGLMALGLGAVMLIDWQQTGVWTAYFKVQAHYRHHLQNPVITWFDDVAQLRHGLHGLSSVPALEAALAALVVVVLVAYALGRRARLPSLELLAVLFAVAVWLFPLSFGTVDIYRSDPLLICCLLVIRRLPLMLALALLAASVALSVPMAEAFFVKVLG